MAETRKTFSEALAAHDDDALKAAFNRLNEAAEKKLHRTTLTRWLDGATPNSEDVVRRLAAELRDDSIFEAWRANRGTRGSSPDRAAARNFESLSADDRILAYPEIRRLYLESRFPKLYEGVHYRVAVNDPPDISADHLMVRLTLESDTGLPARAKVIITPTHRELSDAYEDGACIFRERVPLDPDRLYALLESGPPPILTYNLLDQAGQRMIAPTGSWSSDGVYQFDNDAAENARIRFSFEYPYPRRMGLFFIKFGEWRVAGGAEFTLELNSVSASAPQAFAFPPAGRQREWAVQVLGPNQLVASMGAGGSILADGDGLVLSWDETS